MRHHLRVLIIGLLATCSLHAFAADFPRLDQALPASVDIAAIHPVFDFDGGSVRVVLVGIAALTPPYELHHGGSGEPA